MTLILTTEGAAALQAHRNAGTNPFGTGAKIELGDGQYTPTPARTTLMSALSPAKQYNLAGNVVSNNTLTMGLTDSSTDVFNVGEIGIFDVNDVLVWIVSQPKLFNPDNTVRDDNWLFVKTAGAHMVLSFTTAITGGTANISFTLSFTFPDASEITAGKVFIATGVSDTRANAALHPSQVEGRLAPRGASDGSDEDKLLAYDDDGNIVKGGKLPQSASTTREGIQENATGAETNSNSATRTVTPKSLRDSRYRQIFVQDDATVPSSAVAGDIVFQKT